MLDACAKAIVADQKSYLNLDPLSDEWDQDLHDEIPHYLTEQVEQLSNGQLTVRIADNALFADQVLGVYLYLARCPTHMPQNKKVLEIENGMFLVGIGPYPNGLKLHAEQASLARVAEYRAFVARSDAEDEERKRLEALAQVEVDAIMDVVRNLIDSRRAVEDGTQTYIDNNPSVKDLATLCHRYGIPLVDLVKTALP